MTRTLAGLLAIALIQAPMPGNDGGFRDVTREAGISFVHHADPEKKYIVESMSGGVALFDYDNDGRLDIYFVDSLTVETAGDPKQARSALYRNLGDFKFSDVTDKAGVGHPGWGMGVCTADIDGDGWEDMYVTALGGNKLYRNNHDGTFADVTERAGVSGGGWSTGCGFGDYDRDGDLDLFVSRYVKVDLKQLPQFGRDKTCQYRGVPVQCGPRGLPGDSDFLYRNDGNLRFTEVSAAAGVGDPTGFFGLGIAWFDYNEDGWPDLFVANDAGANFLYRNEKNGTFKEVGFPMGLAVSQDGAEQGSMGVAIADYDNTGRFGILVTNFSEEYNALHRNEGPHFTDTSFKAKLAAVSLPFVGWGSTFFDYDNDGFLDLLIVNGHVYPQLDKVKLGASGGYRQRKLLHRNRGDGTFEEVAAKFGATMMDERVTRGLAIGDLDDDGRLDMVTNDLDGAPQVIRNEIADVGHWLTVKLEGKGPNTGAIGAVVTARAGTLVQKRLVQSGSSYISQEDKRLHFGLGKAAQVDSLEVTWPDGTMTVMKTVKADQRIEITQGQSAPRARQIFPSH